MQDDQKNAFQARLARMGAQQEAVPTMAQPGPADDIVRPTEKRRHTFQTSEDTLAGRLAYPLSFVWAFLLGVLSVFMARFALAHLVGSYGETDDMTLYLIDIGLACAVAFAIAIMLSSAEKEKVTTSAVGVFAAVSLMHNLVWMYPDPFVLIYGEEWVESLLLRSTPSSIFFRGQYIAIE